MHNFSHTKKLLDSSHFILCFSFPQVSRLYSYGRQWSNPPSSGFQLVLANEKSHPGSYGSKWLYSNIRLVGYWHHIIGPDDSSSVNVPSSWLPFLKTDASCTILYNPLHYLLFCHWNKTALPRHHIEEFISNHGSRRLELMMVETKWQ